MFYRVNVKYSLIIRTNFAGTCLPSQMTLPHLRLLSAHTQSAPIILTLVSPAALSPTSAQPQWAT